MSAKNSRSVLLRSQKLLLYASELAVNEQILLNGFSTTVKNSNLKLSDLQPGIYEGGLKIWEGAFDLCNYIDENFTPESLSGKRVLELGCGAALPAIFTVLNGAEFAAVNDFNEFVIECFSRLNFCLNGIPESKWLGVSGDWIDLASKHCDLLGSKRLLAAKVYYFGLGASIIDFEEFVKAKAVFQCRDVLLSSDAVGGVPRKILELRRITSL